MPQTAMGIAKREGSQAASIWWNHVTPTERVDLAGCRLEYGETLDDLRTEGFNVPPSNDRDYSWGFFKQIKGKVHHMLHKAA